MAKVKEFVLHSTAIKQPILKIRNSIGSTLNRRRLKNETFTIISNDCWGGEVYKDLRLAYTTPFVGLFVMAPCYIKMLKHLPEYIHSDLKFGGLSRYEKINSQRYKTNSDYPIGLLKDVELHFVHEYSPEVAYTKWNRRVKRMCWDRLFIKMSDGVNDCTTEHLLDFEKLPYANKVCFTLEPQNGLTSCVYVRHSVTNGARMYRKSQCYFDVIAWLNGQSGELKPSYKMLYQVLYTKGT